jgi:hypothetical protein
MVSLVDPTPWAPTIGRLFLAFGRIEHTTHECIREWAGETVHKHVARTRLAARIDLAIDLASARDALESTRRAFTQELTKARNLAKYRNLVAHNPLSLLILQDGATPPLLEAIAASSSNQHLSLEELEEIVAATEQCAEALLHSFVAFRI